MFGFQRIGDLVWMAGDMQCKGFLVGGTAGRTTLNGEGLQHQDGHSHLLAYPVPNLHAYDPAFAFEIAVIVREGIKRMYRDGENVFYYITVENENYAQPKMPEGAEDGILKGMYKFRPAPNKHTLRAHLLGSGAMMNHALKAQELLDEKYKIAADVWSVTSYKELHRDAMATERWNMLHPGEAPRRSYVAECFADEEGVIVASSDYVKAMPESIAQAFGRPVVSLGTDGYGRSETRENLRDFFEVDYRFITLATLTALAREGAVKPADVKKAIKALDIDVDKLDPMSV
jgi:pyruvate dehydrogenase E1 component